MIDRLPMLALLLGCLAVSGCKSSRAGVVIHRGEVKAIENCRVRVENVFENADKPFAGLEVACGLTNGPNWWGTDKAPLGFTLSIGDCALLKSRFYCATALNVGESVTLVPTYRFAGGDVLTRDP